MGCVCLQFATLLSCFVFCVQQEYDAAFVCIRIRIRIRNSCLCLFLASDFVVSVVCVGFCSNVQSNGKATRRAVCSCSLCCSFLSRERDSSRDSSREGVERVSFVSAPKTIDLFCWAVPVLVLVLHNIIPIVPGNDCGGGYLHRAFCSVLFCSVLFY